MTGEAAKAARAPLVEIFHSIQGEGRYVGVPMVFVRVAVCPIRCRYCDTPESYTAEPQFRVTVGEDVIRQRNPVTAQRACELVGQVATEAGGGPPAISLTGGEPLLYPAFLKRMGEILKTRGHPLHLETAALDPDALSDVLSVVDHLSADYKLPETLQRETREMGDFRSAHRRCVELAVSEGCTVDVKLVLTKGARTRSFRRALADLAPWRKGILLVLQPVTAFGGEEPPSRGWLGECLASARGAGFEARVLPQVHKIMGLR